MARSDHDTWSRSSASTSDGKHFELTCRAPKLLDAKGLQQICQTKATRTADWIALTTRGVAEMPLRR